MLGPGSGVNLTSDTDKPRPPRPWYCSASRSGGWQECELTNNRFSRFGGFFAGKYGDHGVRLLKLRMRSMDFRVRQIYKQNSIGR